MHKVVFVLLLLPFAKSHTEHFGSQFFAKGSPEFHASVPDEVLKLHDDCFPEGIACEQSE